MNNQCNIVVISLADAHERRASAAKQLNEEGLKWSFIDAIDAKNLQGKIPEYDRDNRKRQYGYDMSPGEIACFLSHRLAWEHCVSSQKQTLILEDDFLLKDSLDNAFYFAANKHVKFDILRLQGAFDKKFKIINEYGEKKLVRHSGDPAGAAAYIIRPSSAAILLKRSKRFYVPVDDFIATEWRHSLKVMAILPYPFSTQNFPSTISCRKKIYLSLIDKLKREFFRVPSSISKIIYKITRPS